MRPERIPLRLGEALWQTRRAITVEVRQRRRMGRNRDTARRRARDGAAPACLRGPDGLGNRWIEQQIREPRLRLEGLADGIEQTCADDAAALPDPPDLGQVD